ncbi:hypothetical protein [Bacillus wiedmannii]|uniref:hypothetical protein n=1 Tax=Bacillus wiedmannii TaxID=1890302 RepID=UPI000BFA8CE3|nr:hypothetical protein [Bacillus wiedmannii]MDM5264836.1 hypothetical protein [Bacillus wiedmannii]PFZ98850.1 hypothetical protein COL83_04490 [Bacillus wiedmannii]
MQYSLLENGVDSLKGARDSLETFDDQVEGTYHNLKDAVIFLNHGIEILFKLILKQHSPSLMFSDLKAYQKAKVDMKKQGKSDVFEINSDLRTVTLMEAVDRIEYLCDIDIPRDLRASIMYINKIRNKIMHYGINLDYSEEKVLVLKLKACSKETVDFLQKHIEDLESKINEARIEILLDGDTFAELLADMHEEDRFMEALEESYEDVGEAK